MASYYRRQDTSSRTPVAIRRTSIEVLSQLDEAWLLNAFHSASRALAQRVANENGVPLGFDVLEFDLTSRAHGPKASVTVTATLLERQQSCYAVKYTAMFGRERRKSQDESDDVLLARAAGWTWAPSLGPLSGSFALHGRAELG